MTQSRESFNLPEKLSHSFSSLDRKTTAVSIRRLFKQYGSLIALQSFDLDIQKGELFGLIGPDGAGKTTAFNILSGIMKPTAGTVKVLGLDPRSARKYTGYLTQQFSLYPDLSIEENMVYSAGLYMLPQHQINARSTEYLKLMDLEQFRHRLAGQLSGGMQRKLALCCALISEPLVLFLDQPTTGVDTIARREFWDILVTLTAQGITIVVATPDLDEAEHCDRVALLHNGEIQQVGTPAQLKSNLGLHRLIIRTSEFVKTEEALLPLLQAGKLSDILIFGDRIEILVADLEEAINLIRQRLSQANLNYDRIRVESATLENVFTRLLSNQGELPKAESFPRSQPAIATNAASLSEIAIATFNLNRHFGNFHAVVDLNLQIPYGEIYGLLGANGAGKTTTIKMLCGLLPVSSGRIAIAGQTSDLHSQDLRQRLGYMSQRFTLYDSLTVLENLQFYSSVYGIPRRHQREKIRWVLSICGLEGQEHLLTGKLPVGWKQRVAFGTSVMHEPEILFLDEPTSGVDVRARQQFWGLIDDFARSGTTVLLSTHYMNEAEQCNRICFMVAGRKVTEGSASEIKSAQPEKRFELHVGQLQPSYIYLRRYLEPWRVSVFGDSLHLILEHPDQDIDQIKSLLKDANIPLLDIHPIPLSLEDAFISEVQRARG
jgi:ABC-2 type transport system ATP-binding protein